MTTQDKNNILIAEFIGFKQCKGIRSENGKYFNYWRNEKFSCIKEQEIQIESENGFGLVEQDLLFNEDLKFNSDWNWLMEVVEKIESLKYSKELFKEQSKVCALPIGTKIEAIYNACVEFIKWYNENK